MDHKVVLALNKVKRDLYESSNFKDLPLARGDASTTIVRTDFRRSLKTRGDATYHSQSFVRFDQNVAISATSLCNRPWQAQKEGGKEKAPKAQQVRI